MKKYFEKIKKLWIFQGWIGAIVFILIGLGLIYLVNLQSTAMILLVVIGVIVLFFVKQQDVIPYIYAGLFFAFLFNRFVGVAVGTELPFVAVVSSSMVHDATTEAVHYQFLINNFNYSRAEIDSWPVKDGFNIGDLPVVVGSKEYKAGEVIVYSISQQSVPIIHRIIKINSDSTFVTKGDHNQGLLPFENSVKVEQIKGKVVFVVPKLGFFRVLLAQIGGR